mgnify:CR=1 FL=1
MKRILLVFLAVLTAVAVFSLDEFDKHLYNARIYYENAEFDKVIEELGSAMKIVKKSNQQGMIEAYKYLAFSHVAFEEIDKAEYFFGEILKLVPDYELDKDTTSPKILTVFEKVRTQFLLAQKEKETKKEEPPAEVKKEEPKKEEPPVEVKKEEPKKEEPPAEVKKEEPPVEVKKEEPKKEEPPIVKEDKKKKDAYDYGYNKPKEKKEKKKKDAGLTDAEREAKKKDKKNDYDFSFNQPRKPRELKPPKVLKYTPTTFNAAWRAALVPGWGQIYKGQSGKGWLFLISNIALDAAQIVTFLSVKSAEDDYNANKVISADKEGEYWLAYEDSFKFHRTVSLVHAIFWAYNMVDASFFGWKKIKVNMRSDIKGNYMLALEYKF